ncbi:MAG: hypothetical protein Q9204_004860, partial [Flavoplaca sp. TL-2023a]
AEQAATSNSINALPEPSSQISVLSSLRGSTPNVPDELPGRPIELPIAPSGNSSLDRSFGADFGGSQTTIIPSSQRVVINGQVVIKDSDDERSDSDASLEDLDDLIAPRKFSPISSPSSQKDISSHRPPASRRSTNLEGTNNKRDGSRHATTTKQSPTEFKMPAYKFSLDALLKQTQSYEESRESIQDARQLLHHFEEQEPRGAATFNHTLDKDLLASVIQKNNDETDMGRLMAAIERTEALHQEETWSFFLGNDEMVDIEPVECPPATDQHWRSILEGWLETLEYQATESLTTERLNHILKTIGAKSDALDFDQPVVPSAGELKCNRLPSFLTNPRLSTLCRLLLDHEIVMDHQLLHLINELMAKVIDRIDGNGEENSGLQLQLLRNLPSSNSQQSLLRRRLALAFFFHEPVYLSKDRQDLLNMKAITRYLRQPRFAVNSETDYPGLAAAISILAIGLDNGDPPPIEASKEAIAIFNDDLDMLAQRIKGMFTRIVDTGASHMRRTEAKQVLEVFHSCLVNAVRTKQKPKGMMWEVDTGTEKQKGIMNSFVQRDKATMDRLGVNGV